MKIIFLLALAVIILSSCANSQSDISDTTHIESQEVDMGNEEYEAENPPSLQLLGNLNIDDAELARLVTSGEIPSNITSLSLRSNQITDISPLATLTELRRLHLVKNQITDISPLASLSELTELNLRSNQITDISPLATLTKLDKLNLDTNQITDWSPVAHVEKVFGRP